jgi:hypothetical protein
MPWMKAEAQFPTPINATFTLGISWHLAWLFYSRLPYKKLLCINARAKCSLQAFRCLLFSFCKSLRNAY